MSSNHWKAELRLTDSTTFITVFRARSTDEAIAKARWHAKALAAEIGEIHQLNETGNYWERVR